MTTVSTSDQKYRSSSEVRVARQLTEAGVLFKYEASRLSYFLEGFYLPDFQLPNGIIIEVKGYFDDEDRRKIDAVLKANPGLDLRMVFDNPKAKCRKGRPGTYQSWCEKRGIPCATKKVPDAWLM